MDGDRFDALSKAMATRGVPRRTALKALGGGLAGLAAGVVGARRSTVLATEVTGACHACCQPQAKRDRRPCYDACLTCGGDTNRLCRLGDGSFTCVGPEEMCEEEDMVCANCTKLGDTCYNSSECCSGNCVASVGGPAIGTCQPAED